MFLIRYSLPFFAFTFIFILYWALHQTILISNTKKLSQEKLSQMNFVRLQKEQKIAKKERYKKKPPKLKQISKTPIIKPQINKVSLDKKVDINIVKLPINISTKFLQGASIPPAGLKENSSVIPIVRIPPIYPRRAKILRKEGYVKLQLLISKTGSVVKANVIESKPKKLFDEAALRSVYGWKFKAKVVDGKPVEQIAEQILEFKLR